jgi:hypothetical protein
MRTEDDEILVLEAVDHSFSEFAMKTTCLRTVRFALTLLALTTFASAQSIDNELIIDGAGETEAHQATLDTLTGALAWKGLVKDRLALDFLSPGMYVAVVNFAGQEGSVVRKKVRVD